MEQWAELRREHFVGGKSIKELARPTGLSRNTIRRALRSERPPSLSSGRRPGVLDPFKPEIHRLLKADPKLTGCPGPRAARAAGLRASARRSSMTTCARSGRCSRRRRGRSSARSTGPARSVQFDLWQPREEVPVGHGQTRRGWVVVACSGLLARGRGRVGLLDADRGPAGRDRRLPGAPRRPAEDAGLGSPGRHPRPRRPPDARRSPRSAASCGSAGVSASRPIRRPRAPSSGCRATRRRTSSPAARFANELDFQDQLDAWFARRSTRARTRRCSARPVDRLADELEVMAPLPTRDARHRPALGRRGSRPIRICGSTPTTTRSTRRWSAAASRSPSTNARSPRSRWTPARSPAATSAVFARHRTITALEHARALQGRPRRRRGDDGRGPAAGPLRRS